MKATIFSSALLLVFAVVCQAVLADEEIAPPARRAPSPRGGQRVEKPRRTVRADEPRNGQRGEKLRDLGGRLMGVLAADPSQQSKPLDVLKLNNGIVELLKPLFENEQTIESFKLGFDPAETNFAKDSVKLIASTRLKQSAWSPEPSQIDLSVAARIERGEKGAPQARFDSQLTVETDVVPLANHAMTKFLERTDPERSRGGRPSADSALRDQVRERLLTTPPITSMDGLVDLVIGLTALRLTTTNDRIVELSEELGAAADGPAQQRLAADLAKARLERDRLFDVRPRVERDESGHAVAIHFTMDRSEVAAGQVDHLIAAISAKQVTVDVAGTLVQGMETYPLLIKPLLTNTLSRIQDRDPDTMRMGQGILDGFLRQGRDAVLEEKE